MRKSHLLGKRVQLVVQRNFPVRVPVIDPFPTSKVDIELNAIAAHERLASDQFGWRSVSFSIYPLDHLPPWGSK